MRERLTREDIIARERSISDAETVRRARKAVELELEKRKAMNMPIAVFDKKEKKVFACYPDGTREEMKDLYPEGDSHGK